MKRMRTGRGRAVALVASLALPGGVALAQWAPGGAPDAEQARHASETSAVAGIETTGAATRGSNGGSHGPGGPAGPQDTSFGSGGNEAGSARSLDVPPIKKPVKDGRAP